LPADARRKETKSAVEKETIKNIMKTMINPFIRTLMLLTIMVMAINFVVAVWFHNIHAFEGWFCAFFGWIAVYVFIE
jgi:fucose 4-O-acetylase-like acetyltransferase